MAHRRAAVVCYLAAAATAVQILDIPKTLEYLETQGVTVAVRGADEFPAFFTAASGLAAPKRIDCPKRCAATPAAPRPRGTACLIHSRIGGM